MKAELSIAESSFQVCHEFGPEEAAEYLDRKKKLPATRNPAALVERDAAARNHAVEVGMMIEVLSPGMQHCQKANASAQVSGIARDSSQGFGGGAEQDAIDQPLVLERQGREPLGQRENHMEVLNRHTRGTLFQPLRSARSWHFGQWRLRHEQ